MRAAMAAAGVDPGDRLTVTAADLASDDGWAEAVAGCDYVLHVASPFPPAQPKDPDELIVPARDGALRVLGASLDAGVKRVVMTSSVAAVRHGRPPSEKPYDEADWTDGTDPKRTPYVALEDDRRARGLGSRARARRRGPAGHRQPRGDHRPGPQRRPLLSRSRSVQRLLDGMPAVPRLGFTFVDVRDVADLHIRAMTMPAAGRRALPRDRRFLWMADVAAVLRDRLGADAAKVPSRVAPNILVRVMSLFDGGVALGRGRPRQVGRVLEREGADDARLGAAAGRGLDRGHRAQPDRARGRGPASREAS